MLVFIPPSYIATRVSQGDDAAAVHLEFLQNFCFGKEGNFFFSFEDLEGNFFITTLTWTGPRIDPKIQSFCIIPSHPLIFLEAFSVLLLKDHAVQVQPAMCGLVHGSKMGQATNLRTAHGLMSG
jgi:hypothetical protein